MVRDITYEESLSIADGVHIDVRSPGEFSEDHIPDAVNIPLFSDDERRTVGIIYRLQGREPAVLEGTTIVGGKLRDMIASFQTYRDRTVIISCARGGMRSGSVASLLDSLGFRVCRVIAGYKGYRRWVRETLDALAGRTTPALFILQGLTGSGKTEIIRRMPGALDLEALAGHRSSVFGAMGLEPKSQKSLESGLVRELRARRHDAWCLIEAESRKIGNCHIPDLFFERMRQAPAILMETSMEDRVDVILREYGPAIDGASVEAIVESIGDRLGKKTTEHLIELFKRRELREFIAILLEKYYDPLYAYSIDRRAYIGTITYTGDTDRAIERIEALIRAYREASAAKVPNGDHA